MPLAEGVHALELTGQQGDRELTIHPTAVETPAGLVLLDVGLPAQTETLVAALAEHDLALADVRAVLLTHHDGDHAGGLAAALERAAGRPVVYAHEAAAPFVDGREHPVKADPDAERYPPVPVDVELQDGVVFRTAAGPMRLVFTPGHAPGHLAAHFSEAGLLIAGDALTVDEEGLAGPPEAFTPDLPAATRSVGKLAELEVSRVHCYHGGTVDADTAAVREVYADLAAEHLE